MNSQELPRTAPFDPAARTYDSTFTETTLARWLREQVWAQIANIFHPGDHILELGCGTGEDALWLARRGIQVTATDASEEMLELARKKAKRAGILDIRYGILDINNLHSPLYNLHSTITAIFSNFGPLNCLPERKTLAEQLAKIIPTGGKVVWVVMGPFCLWEIGWHVLHFQFRTAFRRFQAGSHAHTGGGGTVRVWYPSPKTLRREFSPYFRQVKLVGIGAFLPPSYLSHLVDRWPRFFGKLCAWERRWGERVPWNWVNDHYLMVLERV